MPLVPVAAPPQPGSRGVASNLVSPIWGFLSAQSGVRAEPSNLGVPAEPCNWGSRPTLQSGGRDPPSNLGGAQNPRIWGSQSGGNFWGAPLIHRRAALQEPGVLGFPLKGFPSLPEKKSQSEHLCMCMYVCLCIYIYIEYNIYIYIYIFFFPYIYIYI